MASAWVQALLVVCAVGVAFAWRHPGYYMSRRNNCARTGDMCLENANCCFYPMGKDLCATPYDNENRAIATCRPRLLIQKGYRPILEDGADCKSSGECQSGCCSKIKNGRFQPRYVCSLPSRDVMCADYGRKEAKASYNDIFSFDPPNWTG